VVSERMLLEEASTVDPLYRQMNSPWMHNRGTRGNCAYEHTPRVTRVIYARRQDPKETIERQPPA